MRFNLCFVLFGLFLLFSCANEGSFGVPSSPVGQANVFVMDELSVSLSTPVKVPGDFFDTGDSININLDPGSSNPWLVFKKVYLYKVPESGLSGDLVDHPSNGWLDFEVKNSPSCFDDDNYAFLNLQDESCCGGDCEEVLVEFLDAEINLPSDLETGSYLLLFAVGEADENGNWDVWNWVFEEITVHGEDWCEPVPATCGSGDDQDVLISCIDNHLISSECEFSCQDLGNGGFCSCFDAGQDPIPLCSCGDLQRMNEDVTANYKLQGDIDCGDTVSWDDGDGGVAEGFMPIGDARNGFKGSLDGQRHIIRDLNINRPKTNNVGLFGFTHDNAIISGVGIEGGEINGDSFVGVLVGSKDRGSISGSYSSGSVSGNSHVGGLVGQNFQGSISGSYGSGSVSGNSYVGGLVGVNIQNAIISDSYSLGTVSGKEYVGGLVGNSFRGSISGSYASGSVSGSRYVGGFVGQNFQGSISGSYALGSVRGGADVGGLVGYNREGTTISSSYASGIVNGGQRVGGLVGLNDRGGSISSSYASGSVSGGWFIGGLVGSNDRGVISGSYASGSVSEGEKWYSNTGGLVGINSYGSVSSSFWDIDSSGKTSSAGGDGKTTAQLKDQFSYPGSWDFNNVWTISSGVNGGYPYLQSMSS